MWSTELSEKAASVFWQSVPGLCLWPLSLGQKLSISCCLSLIFLSTLFLHSKRPMFVLQDTWGYQDTEFCTFGPRRPHRSLISCVLREGRVLGKAVAWATSSEENTVSTDR